MFRSVGVGRDRARVLVVSASIGAGHDGAADELIKRLRALGVPADRRDCLDALPWLVRFVLREGYVFTVGYIPRFFDWLFENLERGGGAHRLALFVCWMARFRLRRWAAGREVVVSTYPVASQTLGMLRAGGALDAIVVTFLTDPAVHRTWVHGGVDHHLTVTEATSRMGRLAYRTPMRAVGGLVSPRFGAAMSADRRRALRSELGLSDDRPVVLLAAGSLGMGDVPVVVREIAASGVAQVLLLCGRNVRLRARFADDDDVVALGWRDDVPELMALADVLVHNAGGLTLTEALTAGLPAITFRPIPGHGIANAALLAEAGLAPWPKSGEELVTAIRKHATLRRDPSLVLREPDAARVVADLLSRRPHPAGPTQQTA